MKNKYGPPPPPANWLIERVAKRYGVTVEDMKSTRRDRSIMQARFEAYSVLFEVPTITGRKRSLPMVGRLMQRHHTTILYGLRRVTEQARLTPDVWTPSRTKVVMDGCRVGRTASQIADQLNNMGGPKVTRAAVIAWAWRNGITLRYQSAARQGADA